MITKKNMAVAIGFAEAVLVLAACLVMAAILLQDAAKLSDKLFGCAGVVVGWGVWSIVVWIGGWKFWATNGDH